MVLGIEHRALNMRGKYSTVEPYPQPFLTLLRLICNYVYVCVCGYVDVSAGT